ncbi:MAG: indole-3-glycerol phosphate synthase TrpC [Lachnospiraceae bacterium]|nr:indole-3-glycerol phosphate synthase TrpC [Lachnospiraceae bacterium]
MSAERNILEEIAAKTVERVAAAKQEVSLEEMKQRAWDVVKAEQAAGSFPEIPEQAVFLRAVCDGELSFICEVKKASPSKGVIAEDFPYLRIAEDYERAGAAAISVLTEPFWFQGANSYLQEISQKVSVPVLRKDFTVDEYMIYEAKVIGADAVLLICAILDDNQLRNYGEIAESLGMTALVEAHDQTEVDRAVAAGARLIGVNNRDLRTFTVDIHNSIRYRKSVDSRIGFVSESGIRTPEDIAELARNQVNAVLIGETLMRAPDRVAALHALRSSHREPIG